MLKMKNTMCTGPEARSVICKCTVGLRLGWVLFCHSTEKIILSSNSSFVIAGYNMVPLAPVLESTYNAGDITQLEIYSQCRTFSSNHFYLHRSTDTSPSFYKVIREYLFNITCNGRVISFNFCISPLC